MRRIALIAGTWLLLVTGCGSDGDNGQKTAATGPSSGDAQSQLPQGSEPFDLDPAAFTDKIDSPYWPMIPGTRWVYRGKEGGGNVRVEVTVTDKTKKVDGIPARVISDQVIGAEGKPIESTEDWYAQDSSGNVWHLGEDTKEYEDGEVVSTSGSWQSGVDGALAGIVALGKPRVGLSYRQEYYEGEAEDVARVVGLDAKVRVPYGRFEGLLKTRDTTPLEPNLIEFKYYAKGVGPVLKRSSSGGSEELVSFRRPQ